MLQCIVNRKTKELLLTLEIKGNSEDVKGSVYNDEYDSIGFFSGQKIEDLVTKKDGRTYLNFEYCEEGED